MQKRHTHTWFSLLLTVTLLSVSLPTAAQTFYAPTADGEILYYDILTSHNVEVAYNPRHLFYKRVIRIPDHVVHNGTTYTVASIGNMAFHGYDDELDSIILPATIVSIGRAAFSHNTSLHTIVLPRNVSLIGFLSFFGTRLDTITVLAETPPTIFHTDLNTTTHISPFVGTDFKSCILRVPQQSVNLYRHNPYWGRFKNIVGISVPPAPQEEKPTSQPAPAAIEHPCTTAPLHTPSLTFKATTAPAPSADNNLTKISVSYCNYDSHTLQAPYDISLYEGGKRGSLRSVNTVGENLPADSCTTQYIDLPNNLIKRLCHEGITTVTIAVNNNPGRHKRRNEAMAAGNTVTIPLSLRKPPYLDTTETPYMWCGKYYTESGTYYDTSSSLNGCEIISTLQLYVKKAPVAQHPATPTKSAIVDKDSDEATSSIDTLIFPATIKLNNKGKQQRFVIQNLLEGKGYQNNIFIVYDDKGKKVFTAEDISKEEDFWIPQKSDIRAGRYYWHFIGHGIWGDIDLTGNVNVTR